MHKHKHEGVKHHSSHSKHSLPDAAQPKSGNHKPARMPGNSEHNPCSHMQWGDGSHHGSHAYKR